MDYAHLSMLLLAVAIALMCAEFFVPSGGMILVLSIISLAASVWFAWRQWGGTNPTAWWSYVVAVVVLIPVSVGGMLYVFPRTSFGRRVLLEAPSLEEVTPYVEEAAHLSQLIGQVGRTVNLLTPGGLVLINGERMHCESEGVLIDPGQEVQVIGIKGNRLVVRLLEEGPTAKSAAGDQQAPLAHADEPSQVDFDLPRT